MIFEIPGDPIPKARHRYSVRNGNLLSYDPQSGLMKNVSFSLECHMKKALNSVDKKIVMEASSLSRGAYFWVEIDFHMAIPSSRSKRKKWMSLWVKFCPEKPDADNLAKFYLDAANGILWPDDKHIVSLKVSKHYSEIPKTVIRVVGKPTMDIHENIERILKHFTPSRFDELIKDLEDLKGIRESFEGDDRQRAASASAMLVSKIASKYGADLAKIAKDCPDYYKNHVADSGELIDNLPKYAQGKTLC